MSSLTGEQIYEVIKPHLGIGFYGEANANERSLERLETISSLMECLLEDLDDLHKEVEGRYEYSATKLEIKLEIKLKVIEEIVKEYSDGWEAFNE